MNFFSVLSKVLADCVDRDAAQGCSTTRPETSFAHLQVSTRSLRCSLIPSPQESHLLSPNLPVSLVLTSCCCSVISVHFCRSDVIRRSCGVGVDLMGQTLGGQNNGGCLVIKLFGLLVLNSRSHAPVKPSAHYQIHIALHVLLFHPCSLPSRPKRK